MNCGDAMARLGLFVDQELPPNESARVRAHLATCATCCAEVEALRALAGAIASQPRVHVPAEVWQSIAQRLDDADAGSPRVPAGRSSYARLSLAATLLLAVGGGLLALALRAGTGTASASTIDFSVLLDSLPLDPNRAFLRFVMLYGGVEIRPADAKAHASRLDFEAPEWLPGGFQRAAVYALHFGVNPGVAVRYDRHGEFLAAIFHPTVHPEQFGTHQDYPCVIGDHHGHEVRIGDWRMVHVTDPTTCHCVLTRLGGANLEPILHAVAPRSRPTRSVPAPHG